MRRIAGWVLVAAGLTGIMAGECRAARPGAPELKVAERLDALLNAGKAADAAALFSDGATVKTPDGRTLTGRDAIAAWLGSLAGFHVDSGNRQAWEEGRVTWIASLSDHRLRELDVDPLAANAEVTVKDGMITTWVVRYTSESRIKLAEATAKSYEGIYRASLKASAAGPDLLVAIPDLALAANEVVVAGSRVAVRGTLSGTWTGVYFGVTGTGQPVTAGFVGTARMDDGAVIDAALIIDTKTLLDQMGFTITHPALAPRKDRKGK